MRVRLNYIFLALFFLPIAAFADNASDVFTNLFAHLKTYQATFEQSVYDEHGQRIQQGHGKIMIKRPGKFYWEAEAPTRQITIINGSVLWLYDVDLAQATKQTINKEMRTNPASLLSDSPEEVDKQFTVSLNKNGTHTLLFTLRPQSSQDINVSWIKLRFVDQQLVGMAFQDNLGQKSVFTFSHVQQNAQLSDSIFQFKAPKGVDVIDNG